jgi:hypothetical protein
MSGAAIERFPAGFPELPVRAIPASIKAVGPDPG